MMPNSVPRLQMRSIGKSFGGIPVLSNVDLVVEAGEVVALLGSNGAGKSTLMKILVGTYGRDAGSILIDGQERRLSDPGLAVAAGIRLLPQEISVMPDMTVAENIFLGDLPMTRSLGLPTVDDRAMKQRSRDLLNELGFGSIDVSVPVKRLSVAEQRIIEIARALAGDASIMILDEPTAALTHQEALMIFKIIRRLREKRVSIIYISHHMSEVFEISDHIAVLRDGRNAGVFVTAETNREDVLLAMLGRAVGDLYVSTKAGRHGQEVLGVTGLAVAGKLSDISCSIRAGEIFGVFGLVGSGVEVLGRALFGVLGPLQAGKATLAGKPFNPRSPLEAKAAGVGFVAAERKKEGIIADLSVRENIVLPFQDRFVQRGLVSRVAEDAQARRWIDGLGIRTRGPEQRIRTLSGGNQQKVCIARWLVDGMQLLILEEPTRGVDVGARKEIYAELRDLADRGFAVLVLSSDVEEVAGLSDRSLVLDRGAISARFEGGAMPTALIAATSSDPAFDEA
jgi:ribose transport system ATP-binding protein